MRHKIGTGNILCFACVYIVPHIHIRTITVLMVLFISDEYKLRLLQMKCSSLIFYHIGLIRPRKIIKKMIEYC